MNLTLTSSAFAHNGGIPARYTCEGEDLSPELAWSGLPELGTYGTVTSACVLSQLVDAVIHAVGEAHPRCLEVITAIRNIRGENQKSNG